MNQVKVSAHSQPLVTPDEQARYKLIATTVRLALASVVILNFVLSSSLSPRLGLCGCQPIPSCD